MASFNIACLNPVNCILDYPSLDICIMVYWYNISHPENNSNTTPTASSLIMKNRMKSNHGINQYVPTYRCAVMGVYWLNGDFLISLWWINNEWLDTVLDDDFYKMCSTTFSWYYTRTPRRVKTGSRVGKFFFILVVNRLKPVVIWVVIHCYECIIGRIKHARGQCELQYIPWGWYQMLNGVDITIYINWNAMGCMAVHW